MPLSRPSPYSPSSVTPLSAYPPSPRPPNFLPPSHYAAAGGFALPHSKNANSSNADSRDAYPISTEVPDDVKSGGDKRFTFRSNSSRNKRESQLVNLPMVETQLLPSLRDTIDRMTRPPSRASPSTLKVTQSRVEQSPSQTDHSRSPRARTPVTPKPSAPPLRPDDPPSTPRTPKSVLKSALRAPICKVSEPTSTLTPAPATGGSALKSVRGLLRRKSSATSNPPPKEPQTSIPVRPARLRSRTDPGSIMKLVPSINPPATPQPPRRKPFVSNIPRLRGSSTDESDDPQYYFEPKRRLMVANADVFASSSSSDTDNEVATPVQPKWQGRGLGLVFSPDKLDFLSPEFDSKRMSAASYASSESDYPEDDEEEDFEEAHRKRKAALLGIVNGLELSHPDVKKDVDDDSEYNGVEGLAISGSGGVEETVSESEYEDDERPPTVIVSSSAGRSYKASSPAPVRSSLMPNRDAPYYDIAQHSHVAAARQRRAFGIPPSESDEVYRGTQAVLSHADSVLSEMNWQDDEEREDLSEGAEALFRTLSGGRRKSRISSIAEKEEEAVAEVHRDDSPTQRQDVFRIIRETEATFVQRITHVIRLFVLPLRVQDSKAWISGVPLALSRLFDWLEDILNLHTQILEVLQSVNVCSEGLRQLIPRLEIYQPYLVRLAESVDALKGFVEDSKNDFGEFVRMQQTEEECDGWSLERFLVEPVNRIAVYPGLFKQLLDATPRTHGDYLSTVCLVHSTEIMIKAMTDVKLREDEYEFTKTISRRISGLPDIARRDRRLLQHGQVHRVHQDQPISPLRDRSSRLVNAINDWDNRRARSGSTTTESSASSWEMPPSPSPSSRQPSFNLPNAIHLFVFSDLLVSCVPLQDYQDSTDGLALCEDFGITRILEVRDDMEQDISLELLPVYDYKDIHCKYIGALPSTAQLQQLRIRTLDKAQWLSAFQNSARTTAPLLSVPVGLDYEDDGLQRTFVDSLVESGLPIPRSPSFQFEGSDRRQEREERGWWSLRFREVLREHLGR